MFVEYYDIYKKDRIKYEIAGNIPIIGTHTSEGIVGRRGRHRFSTTNDAFLLKERSFIWVEKLVFYTLFIQFLPQKLNILAFIYVFIFLFTPFLIEN